jgi:VCBS repeat-containing protein
VVTNDSDADAGAVLSYALDAPVAGLTLDADGSYSFDPTNAAYQSLAAGESIDVVASYTVTDDQGATASSTLTITVTGTNDDPVINEGLSDLTRTTTQNVAVTGDIVATDVDAGDVLVYAVKTGFGPANGTVTFDGNQYSYTSTGAFYGTDSFTVEVSDGQGGTDEVVVTVTVNDVTPPAAPVITGYTDDTGLAGDGRTGDTTPTLSGTAEAGATITVRDGVTVLGTTTANGSGAWSFSTAVLAYGLHTLTATATDASGNTSAASAALALTILNPVFGDGDANALAGTAMDDAMVGLAGADSFTGSAGADDIDGGADFDTVSYAASAAAVTVDLQTGTGSGGDAAGDRYFGIEAVIGSAFSDSLTGDGADNLFVGGTGADTFTGGGGSDTVDYSGSNAALSVQLSNGNGSPIGGTAAGDKLFSIENLIGTDFADTINGDQFANRFVGGLGADTLRGGAGDDSLAGGDGNDQLTGNEGNDTIVGGDGADRIYGSENVDILTGDGGATDFADQFFWTSEAHSGVGAGLRDVILDFDALDIISLASIDANLTLANDQAFQFIGTAVFSGAGRQLRYFVDGSGNTIIQGDVAGVGAAGAVDFEIELRGYTGGLGGSDFQL